MFNLIREKLIIAPWHQIGSSMVYIALYRLETHPASYNPPYLGTCK